MKAIWKDTIVAESDDTVVVESNHYFPHEALREEYRVPSETTTVCPWKGTAHYYTLKIGDDLNPDAVWFYPTPHLAAERIRGRVAFWKGVRIVP